MLASYSASIEIVLALWIFMSNEVSLYEKQYPKKWVVMQNRITQAFREMSIDEKRLIILASPIVRLSKATEQTAIEILASDFASFAELDSKSAYKQMKAASKKLMKRTFVYDDKNDVETEVQWVIRSKYQSGYVTVFFTDEVIELLKIFDEANPYTKYLKQDILSLKLTYSIDLYHLAKKHQRMGSFIMSLDAYRQELGTPKSYKRINNLKDNAVDSPIKEINDKTDINITYENVKRGKEVVGLKFIVKTKQKPLIKEALAEKTHQESENMLTAKNLTDRQIEAIVCTKEFKADYNHLISPTSPINTNLKLWKPEMSKLLKTNTKLFDKRPLKYYLDRIVSYQKT